MNAIFGHLLAQILPPTSVTGTDIEISSNDLTTTAVVMVALLFAVFELSKSIPEGMGYITTGYLPVVSLFTGFWLAENNPVLAVSLYTLTVALWPWRRISASTCSKTISSTVLGCGQILVLGTESEHEILRWILIVFAFFATLSDMQRPLGKAEEPPSTTQK